MKVGDLVKSKAINGEPRQAGLILELVEKKCWRTQIRGQKVDWDKIDPEPHAVVLFRETKLTIPITDLELLDEDR